MEPQVTIFLYSDDIVIGFPENMNQRELAIFLMALISAINRLVNNILDPYANES